MSDSTRLIKKYYHSIKSVNMTGVIDQVDQIAALASSILKADFLAVFYRKEGNENLIPIAYCNNTDIQNPSIQKLEQIWCHSNIQSQQIMEGLMYIDKGMHKDIPEDRFAFQYGFKYVSQSPFYINNNIQVFVLAYWYEEPDYEEKQVKKSFSYLFEIINNLMVSIYDNKIINDYTIRLSDLIALFEIPIQEYSLDDLINKLFKELLQIVPGSYMLMSYEGKEEGYIIDSNSNADIPQSSFLNLVSKELSDLTTDLKNMEEKNGIWVDLSKHFKEYYKIVLATPLFMSSNKTKYLLTVSDNINSISKNDKQLLSLFSLFSGIILKISAMLEKEKKVNKLLKKTSSQMADVETLAALTDMTSGVAHDFNNMIGGIIGRVQLLKLKVEDDAIVEKLDKIEQLAQDGAETVKRIQEFTSGAKYKELEQLDIIDVLNDYFENTNWKWIENSKIKNIAVTLQKEIESAPIEGSHADLLIALDKLIENGVEHADENSKVELRISNANGYWELQVHNRGSFINEADQNKIFYPFYTTKHEYGAGMGLAIVHGIVTRHGGKISVTSSIKEGTTFKILFPIIDVIKEDSEITRRDKKHEDLRILVVDDDEQIRDVLTDMLTIDGYLITSCEDGPSALKAFESSEFEIMITDLGMPGMSGLELAGIVHEKKPEMPIAMITGWGTQLNQDEVALKGIKAVLPKPFHLKDIKSLIKELVEHV